MSAEQDPPPETPELNFFKDRLPWLIFASIGILGAIETNTPQVLVISGLLVSMAYYDKIAAMFHSKTHS